MGEQPREVEKTEQTTCPCKVKLIMIGRKLECTAVCNTEYMGLSMEVHTFTQLLMTIPAVVT